MIKVSARDYEMFAHLLGLFGEAGVTVTDFAGGNEFYVPDGTVVDDDDLRAEIADAVMPGTLPAEFAPRPPGGDDTPAPVPEPPQERVAASAERSPQGQADLQAPPSRGPGSGRAAWADFLKRNNLDVSPEMSRDDMIEAWEAKNRGS